MAQTLRSVKQVIDKAKREHIPLRFLGKNIGSGISKTAYRIGDYVVKERDGIHYSPSKVKRAVKSVGLTLALTKFYRGYMIQRYYKSLDELSFNDPRYVVARREFDKIETKQRDAYETKGSGSQVSRLDLHEGNMGVDVNGRLIAFDW